MKAHILIHGDGGCPDVEFLSWNEAEADSMFRAKQIDFLDGEDPDAIFPSDNTGRTNWEFYMDNVGDEYKMIWQSSVDIPAQEPPSYEDQLYAMDYHDPTKVLC